MAEDKRSDIEQAVESRADEAKAAGKAANKESPLAPTGVYDGVSGSSGEVKDQDRTAQ